MVWHPNGPQGRESDKICHIAVQYTRGLCLDVGCGKTKVWPSCIGLDSGKQWGERVADITAEGDTLPMFSDKSLDGVFSSHFLEHVVDYKATLREWWRVIKPGGYLSLYLPHKNFYPNIGQDGANPDHKHDFMPADIVDAMKEIATDGATVVEDEERNGTVEYSFFQVYRKRTDGKFVYAPWRRPAKSLLFIRYSAIGDQIVAGSALPLLKEQGWHITYQTTPLGEEVMRGNPYIDAWWVQDKGQVPQDQLSGFWESMFDRYDRVINLSQSMEVALLARPFDIPYGYSDAARHKLMNVNYLERTHDICDVPHRFNPRFYPLAEEFKEALEFRNTMNGPVVYVAINGTSIHKLYAHMDAVILWLIQRTPCHVVLTADPGIGKIHQDALIKLIQQNGGDISRVHGMAGKWSIRQSLTFSHIADCVLGPETGIIWSAMFENVPKVVMLSHSSFENFAKHSVNLTALESRGCPKSPCHQLHYDNMNSCPRDDTTKLPLCSSALQPIEVFDAVVKSLGLKRQAA